MRILRGLSSQFLPCGCLTGVYETYDGSVVGILDAKSGGCRVETHRTGKLIPVDATVSTPVTPSDAASEQLARD
jgi:hypothetical protein